MESHTSLARAPGALRLLGISVAARLPLAMLSLGLLVHTHRLTGSYSAAGAVTGAYAVAEGIGGPLLGRLVDRRGQSVVLIASAASAAVLLGAVALLPAGVPVVVPVLLAAGIGFATPPVGACLRTLLPELIADPGALGSAYAVESSVLELTFVAGPPLVLGLGVAWSSGGALAAAGAILLGATIAFALQPGSRRWRPARASTPHGGALRAPAMRTLVVILVAVGVVYGAVEVGVTAAAQAAGGAAAAGPLLALWGAGSLAGGVVAARAGGGIRTGSGLVLVLAALTAGHLALAAVAASVPLMALVIFLAGAAIAPTAAGVYGMVDRAAPPGTVTEAFAWLATAIAVGTAAGAAAAGALVDGPGPVAAFVLAGAAGLAAVCIALVRGSSLAPAPVPALV